MAVSTFAAASPALAAADERDSAVLKRTTPPWRRFYIATLTLVGG